MGSLRRLARKCRTLAKQHIDDPDVPAAPDGATGYAKWVQIGLILFRVDSKRVSVRPKSTSTKCLTSLPYLNSTRHRTTARSVGGNRTTECGSFAACSAEAQDKGLRWKRVDPIPVYRFRVLWCTVVARCGDKHLFALLFDGGEWASYRRANSPQNAPGVAPSEVGRSATRRGRSRAVLPRLPDGRLRTEPARCVSRHEDPASW